MEWHGAPRVAFVVVTKGLGYPTGEDRRPSGARYTRDAIRGMLQFMGCKPRHAYKAAQLVFQKLENVASDGRKFSSGSRQLWGVGAHDEGSVYVAMPRSEFYELVCSTLTEYNYKYAPSSDEIKAACSLKERRRHIIVLLCGTSGSGKSTLASILASRLGISTVLSTDSVRHMMRGFTSPEETPLLFASTYEAGEALRKQQAMDEARLQTFLQQQQQQQQQQGAPSAQRTMDAVQQTLLGESPVARVPALLQDSDSGGVPAAPPAAAGPAAAGPSPQGLGTHDLVIRGYKAQCELVSEQLEQLICGFEARRQSLVVEGVHLHVGLVMRLLQRHPGVVPFLVYIKSESKHVERMAVRAKYMTLDPNKNKYVKNMRNIRWIQDYLFRKADKHAIPCVENTNVDRSVGLIHLTLLGCLKRMMKGEQVLDAGSSLLRMLHNEYTSVVDSLAGMGSGPGPNSGTTNAAAAVSVPAAAPCVIAAAAAATTPAGSGSSQAQRENSGGLVGTSALPSRMLASPHLIAAANLVGSGTVCGDSGDVYGEAALVAAAAVAAAAGSAQHPHSSSQLDLAVPYQSCAEAAAMLLSSSPQHPHQQRHPVLLQVRTNRRSSCSAPFDISSPAPSPPHSGSLALVVTLSSAMPQPTSPMLLPGTGSSLATAAAGREACWSPVPSSPSAQLPVLRHHTITGSALEGNNMPSIISLLGPVRSIGLDSATVTPKIQAPALLPSPMTLTTQNDLSEAITRLGNRGRGRRVGLGTSPASCEGDGLYTLAQGDVSGQFNMAGCRMAADQRHPPLSELQPQLPEAGTFAGETTHTETAAACRALALPSVVQHQQHKSCDDIWGDEQQQTSRQRLQPPEPKELVEYETYQQVRDHEQMHSDMQGNASALPDITSSLLVNSPVCGAHEPGTAISIAYLSSRPGHSCRSGIAKSEDSTAATVAEPVTANTSLSRASGQLTEASDDDGVSNGKASAAPISLVPQRVAASGQALSPEQRQHVEAVLPVCMERLGAGGVRPPLPATAGVDTQVSRCSPQPVSVLGRIEEGRESGDAEGLHVTEGNPAGGSVAVGHRSTAETVTMGMAAVAAADISADRSASAAFAAAKDAYSRFGDSCPEEVLRVVMESAILDEQMDGVTEQQPQQHSESPEALLSNVDAGSLGTGDRQGGLEGKDVRNQGIAANVGRFGEKLQQHRGLAPVGSMEVEWIEGLPNSLGAVIASSPSAGTGAEGWEPTQRSGAGAAAFAGINAWSAATTASLGAPPFLRTSSRRLGESSSSPSRSGYSSDDAGAAGRDAGRDRDEDDGDDDGDISLATAGGGSGGGCIRRRRPTVRLDSSPGTRAPGDSDDPDGDGYGMYDVYGGASPLQEYGSVYESATHDDMDEHGDDEEGMPLGRTNTIIRHLAGALVRSRMRASASAAAAAATASGRPVPHAQPVYAHQPHRASGPPPAASTGAALRLSVSRKSPPLAEGPRQLTRSQQPPQYDQHVLAGSYSVGNPRMDWPGGGAGRGRQEVPTLSIGVVDQQLRQILRGGVSPRLRLSAEQVDHASDSKGRRC